MSGYCSKCGEQGGYDCSAATVRLNRVADAIMRARVSWGWTFGKRAKVMAVDLMMAEAAIKALNADCAHLAIIESPKL